MSRPVQDAAPSLAQALVVSGFLGSGKTTLVRRLLEEGQREGIRTAVVSNEFGELGIDEALMAGSATTATTESGTDYVELSGGCVCCRLSDDLLRTLQELWERSRPERVIVETSGVALPYDTLLNFWRDPVRQWAIDESSVVVVSAEQVAAGRDLDQTFEDQVCSADLLLLSKTDLVTDAQAQAVEEHLRRLQGDVEIVRATMGDADPRLFFPPEAGSRQARSREHDHDHDDDGHAHSHEAYESTELRFEAGVAEDQVRRALEDRAALRAKGFVETGGGLRLVQGVAGRVELTAPNRRPHESLVGRVVVIERRRRTSAAEPTA